MNKDFVSEKELLKVGLRGYKDTVKINWHGIGITLRYLLNRSEEVKVVHSILKCCTNQDGTKVVPEFIDLATMANIVSAYANVEMPKDIDEQHKLLMHSDLYDVVVSNVCKSQIDSILKMVMLYL